MEINMIILKAAFCRIYQMAFRVALPVLPYRVPEIVPSCEEVGKVLKKEKVSSVIIVTDKGITDNGLTRTVEEALTKNDSSYVIYDKTQPNPTVDNVEEAFKLYTDNGCTGIIAIGGGSAMDCAKAVGVRASYPKKSIGQLKGVIKVLRRLPLLIAIPTTAGTGSEVTPVAIITDSNARHKYAVMSFPLIPHYAVLDPMLTYSLPPHLTAATGMDTLTHAVEAYIGRSTTRETRKLALEATKLVFQNLETAYADGQNFKARENMLHAAYMAGIAFSKSYVGYIHAVAHSLGGQYGIPHGLANTVIMPYVLDMYGKKTYKKLYSLGIAAGVADLEDTPREGAAKFIKAIRSMNKRMNIPDRLQGIKKEDIFVMAGHAEKEANPLYPVPKLMTRKELEKIYYKVADWSVE